MNILQKRRISKKVWRLILAFLMAALLSVVIFLVWGRLSPIDSRAAISKGNIYSSWSAERVSEGDKVDLEIRINPEAEIDTVMAEVAYDSELLQYESTDYEAAVFPTQIPASTTDDGVRVTAAIMGGGTVSKDSRVATVTFRALKDQRVEAKLSGGSARAGEALNPRVNGELGYELKQGQDSQPVAERWLYSAAGGVGLIVISGLVYLLTEKIRKGRKKHDAVEK